VEEFNKGVYDIILATDKTNLIAEPASDDEEEQTTPKEHSKANDELDKKRKRIDPEYGVSRGIDFQNVSFVINFDLPRTSKSYLHRIGRTARAGTDGTALSFIIPPDEYGKSKHSSFPTAKHDTKVLSRIRDRLASAGRKEIEKYTFDSKQLEAFRYRMTDALRAVTKTAVHQARAQEIRKEIIKSEKLKRHFDDNPQELDGLRHDEDLHVVRRQAHLKHVPDYLVPGGAKAKKDLGFIGYKKEGENRIRKARLNSAFKKKGGKGRKPKRDPLKSFKPGK
jgi:ATP-dependent RNA helicase DDX56/DBP9